jgi:hypothetical protein
VYPFRSASLPSTFPQWFVVATFLTMLIMAFLGFTNFTQGLFINDKVLVRRKKCAHEFKEANPLYEALCLLRNSDGLGVLHPRRQRVSELRPFGCVF